MAERIPARGRQSTASATLATNTNGCSRSANVGGEDLNEQIVREGCGLDFRKYSSEYLRAEAEAKRATAGSWHGEFTRQGSGRWLYPIAYSSSSAKIFCEVNVNDIQIRPYSPNDYVSVRRNMQEGGLYYPEIYAEKK